MNNNPKIILIGGPPVVGKTSLAHELSKKTGIKRVIDVDVLRDVLRKEKFSREEPYIYHYSTTAWRIKGKYTQKNLIDAYINYCQDLRKAIESVIESSYKFKIDTIIEGVHLLPEFFEEYLHKENFKFFILYLGKKDYIKNIQRRKEENHNVNVKYLLENVDKAVLIGEYLMRQSKKRGIPLIHNASIKKSCNKIIKFMKIKNE
ncbi:MAG: AAA family ATPase [Candidatus Pacearchaeota archaeon]